MELNKKINALVHLGEIFTACLEDQLDNKLFIEEIQKGKELIKSVHHTNGWFTSDSVELTFKAWSGALKKERVEKWLKEYDLTTTQKKVGVIMAGNIPLVGLHDALCVLVTGNQLYAKLSTKDKELMSWVLSVIGNIEPEWKENIILTESLKGIDCLIATGSDNSNRYFEYYFKDINKILRKNRTSVAILDGNETEGDLSNLAKDVFAHYGLGCRSVTKLYLPKGFDLDRLFGAFFPYKEVVNHNKYGNNYDYNKAIYLLNSIELVENGFLLLKEDEGLHSPVGVLFYEYYQDLNETINSLSNQKESIQCLVGKVKGQSLVDFGEAQSPNLWDYADNVDTIQFLSSN